MFQFPLYSRNVPQTLGCYFGEKQAAFSDHCHPYLHPVKAYLVSAQFAGALAQCSETFPLGERMSVCVASWFERRTSSFLCDCVHPAGHTQTDRHDGHAMTAGTVTTSAPSPRSLCAAAFSKSFCFSVKSETSACDLFSQAP